MTSGVYHDPDSGKRISTNSMLKTFRRCPKQAEFKYFYRLKPKRLGAPLHRGKWFHECLEWFYTGRDWEEIHTKYVKRFNEMFDEEKDYYGDLPRIIEHLMKSYIWHYANDPWEYHEVEIVLETEFPDGTIYRGRADALVENSFGLWIVDHKTHKIIPSFDDRLLDTQSPLYVWTARRNKIPVQGFIWNYIRWKEPSTPVLLKDGTRLSKSPCDTDYPTYVRALKKYAHENDNFTITDEYKAKARELKNQRYVFGEAQTSPFFQRVVLERNNHSLRTAALEAHHTSQRMHSYEFGQPGVERTIDRSCKTMCAYTSLCTTELVGGNVDLLRKQNFYVGDPNDYYYDQREDVK